LHWIAKEICEKFGEKVREQAYEMAEAFIRVN
jgi:hypothetical protein